MSRASVVSNVGMVSGAVGEDVNWPEANVGSTNYESGHHLVHAVVD